MNPAKIIPFQPQTEAQALVREGLRLKGQSDEIQARLREIDIRLAELAQFEPGKKTATVDGGDGFRAKVTTKEYEKWDQEALATARNALGDDTLFRLFKWEFSPRSKKDLDGFLSFADEPKRQAVLAALTIKPGKPAVAYERVDG